ncbi:hypothetical protein PybrP1_007194 [[Pythium] brassicae (nom. inval.)]|nr:hypothetical protein PybrP1_007194 [[Pythium] brassicae (nom. inval.)]
MVIEPSTPRSGGLESFVYKIVESAPLPAVDLSKSVRSVWLNGRLGQFWMRFLRRHHVTVLQGYYISIALLFGVCSVKAATGRWLAIAVLLMGTAGALSSISMLRSDIVRLLSSMHEVWFFSIVNTLSSLLLALHLADVRAVVVLPLWCGVQSGIFLDANITRERHFVITSLLSSTLITMVAAQIGLGILDGAHSFVIFPSSTRPMTAEVALVNGWTTIALLLCRNMYRRRQALKKLGIESSKLVQCISYRVTIKLVQVGRATESANVVPVPAALARARTTVGTLLVQMNLVAVDEVFDSADTVFRLGRRVLTNGDAPSWLRVLTQAMAYSGLCLTFAGVAGVQRAASMLSTHVASFVVTAMITTLSFTLYQRTLLRRMVWSFDYAFLVFQIALAHGSICDLLYWDHRCFSVAASLLWVHWVLLVDAITPVTKRRWGIRLAFAGAIMGCFIASQLLLAVLLVFDTGVKFQDRSVLDVTLFGRAVQFRTVPLILSRTATLVAWSFRVVWRIARRKDDELVIMQGGVVFERNMRSSSSSNGVEFPKKRMLVRVSPRYVRLRQGSEIRYTLKLTRPITKGKAVTIHVCVIMNKSGVTVSPQQLVVTASDWKLPREVVVASDVDSEVRTVQIHHKIHETLDELYNANTAIPSVFVSVLQKEATFLFAFGCGLDGRLGGSDEANANAPTPFACKWLHPVQIACGKAHSAIIDVYSNIYCFGLGASGQLGQGDSSLDASKLPLRVPTVGASTILHVACGSHHTMCLTAEGKVFAWGDNASGQLGLGFTCAKPRGTPARVEKLANVRTIVCGGSHSFVTLLDNSVLAAGSNIAGQLGLGDRRDRAVFERVPFFRKLFAPPAGIGAPAAPSSTAGGDVELACGLYHSLALCGKRVYSWGNGDDGRLGHGNVDTCLEPTLVAALSDTPVKAIACGGSHSGALAASGDVFLWGNGQHGQLGLGALRSRRTPSRLRALQGKHVTQLSFGEWHSMALCDGGALFAWGFGEEGQLGLPDDARKPSRVVPLPSLVHSLAGTGATMVRCGGSHTFVVSVLEARRPQLARLHRQAARQRLPHSRSDPSREGAERATTSSEPKTTQPRPGALTRKPNEAPTQRFNLDDDPAPARVPAAAVSWKERPMTTRAAVRNAFRQEAKALADAREALAPLPTPAPVRATSASAVLSPRLRRLHEQMLRGTEAGAGRLKCQSVVGSAAASASIASAVELATKAFCDTETTVGLGVVTTRTGKHAGGGPEGLVAMLRELRGAATLSCCELSDSDSDEASDRCAVDDEIAFVSGAGRRVCASLEREVAWQLSCP